jgi:hypothetical protein
LMTQGMQRLPVQRRHVPFARHTILFRKRSHNLKV